MNCRPVKLGIELVAREQFINALRRGTPGEGDAETPARFDAFASEFSETLCGSARHFARVCIDL